MSIESKGVSNCYVFKSRLQEYAQKVGFPTPVYETIKEGPSHEPFFRSTVIVNNVRYDSLPGFSNRKAAEQSAAEVALVELSKSGEMKECISQPVHETGLCKNLLQEYAQKMNYAMPTYECRRQDTAGRATYFFCTVEIGGIRYIGAVARTKKEAEIKAARTALLAIQSSSHEMGENADEEICYTVVPGKRKEPETVSSEQEAVKSRKPRKGRFKKKPLKKRHHFGAMTANLGSQAITADGLLNVPISNCQPMPMDAMKTLDGSPNMNQSHGDALSSEVVVIPNVDMSDCQPISMNVTPLQGGISNMNQTHAGPYALQDAFTAFRNGFSNSETLECQPVSEVTTGADYNETLNMNQSHGYRYASDVLAASLVTDTISTLKNDAVDQPADGCIVEPSSLSQSNVSDSSKHDEGSAPDPLVSVANSSTLIAGDDSQDLNKKETSAYAVSIGNQTAADPSEPAAAASSLDYMGEGTRQTSEV